MAPQLIKACRAAARLGPTSELGQKRKSLRPMGRSALPSTTDIISQSCNATLPATGDYLFCPCRLRLRNVSQVSVTGTGVPRQFNPDNSPRGPPHPSLDCAAGQVLAEFRPISSGRPWCIPGTPLALSKGAEADGPDACNTAHCVTVRRAFCRQLSKSVVCEKFRLPLCHCNF
jgi:hypothetical protein